MRVLNCKGCDILFDEYNKPKDGNYCRPCIYKKDKKRQEEKFKEVKEKECIKCKISKALCKFPNPEHNSCRTCSKSVTEIDYTEDLVCNSCDIRLTIENKVSDRKQCKECVNKRKREAREKKKGKELEK